MTHEVLLRFHPSIMELGQLIQLDEERTNQLLSRRLVIAHFCSHLMPQLDFQWFSE